MQWWGLPKKRLESEREVQTDGRKDTGAKAGVSWRSYDREGGTGLLLNVRPKSQYWRPARTHICLRGPGDLVLPPRVTEQRLHGRWGPNRSPT